MYFLNMVSGGQHDLGATTADIEQRMTGLGHVKIAPGAKCCKLGLLLATDQTNRETATL